MAVWHDPNPAAQLAEPLLEWLKVKASTAVDRQLLRDAQVEVLADVAGRLIFHLQSYVLAEHLDSHTQTAEVRVPATWWDHAKTEMPTWLWWWWNKRVWRFQPIRYRTRTLTATWTERAVYPHAILPLPDRRLGPAVLWRDATTHLEDPL